MFEIYRYAYGAADACSPSTLQFSRHGGFLTTQGRTLVNLIILLQVARLWLYPDMLSMSLFFFGIAGELIGYCSLLIYS